MSSIRRKLSWFAPVVVPRVRIRAGPALVVPGPSSSPSSAGSQGDAQTTLTVGHPKLQNDLRRPTMEEIGHRTTIVSFKGIAGQQRPYLDWLLTQCLAEGVLAGDVITEEALELLAPRLGTPLQIARYLTHALEEGWRVGEKPVTAQLVEALLSPQLAELEPRLRRHGYDIPDLAELISARQGEIRSLLRGELEPARGQELTAKLMAAGLPV